MFGEVLLTLAVCYRLLSVASLGVKALRSLMNLASVLFLESYYGLVASKVFACDAVMI